ncbi:hypothetical protein EI42_02906 [Thermosporothrix hazakensis]|jgi:hypothetical protein|uniref:Uncharacterized protein n=2 Tax=Thermosporothrix TaxID=768650 RepID=A0A326U7M8_THEHA|nr:hypothetical protein [Thermosporothrix hazakensis]PZW29185.1 hypothetical protein EI42_02906 [Thermosporothrix hazakensis]BBH86112.1 hypothetical protein KTC_08630 [Thermosporothrix sp. COM3]GCE45463.1 hypothetical protein KTH_03320 [Thermosporothrix hazakensis]
MLHSQKNKKPPISKRTVIYPGWSFEPDTFPARTQYEQARSENTYVFVLAEYLDFPAINLPQYRLESTREAYHSFFSQFTPAEQAEEFLMVRKFFLLALHNLALNYSFSQDQTYLMELGAHLAFPGINNPLFHLKPEEQAWRAFFIERSGSASPLYPALRAMFITHIHTLAMLQLTEDIAIQFQEYSATLQQTALTYSETIERLELRTQELEIALATLQPDHPLLPPEE